MCGIAGIIYRQAGSGDDYHIKQISDLVAHRGPDGSGYWNNGKVYFGHRRLSILDLSDAGAQPMRYKDYIITYNGEVYNYLEIRQELIKAGYSFESECDTEVILAAYDYWGENCQTQFNGMWAFAIFDPVKSIVFCSRDRFGIKPFYYLQHPEKFVFGSEIKQLLHFVNAPKANVQSLVHYLGFSQIDVSEHTFFSGIQNLPGSHCLVYDLNTNTTNIKRYYEVSRRPEYEKLSFDETMEMFGCHFSRAVNLRLRSDVQVGTCLSGGLDSSLIALVASRNYKQTAPKAFAAFTAESIDPFNNDEPYAKMVADTLALDWHVTTPTKTDFFNSIHIVCRVMEEPAVSPSVFMQHFVMQKAQQQGLKVLLDGQGGDETLLGYSRYLKSMSLQKRGKEKIDFILQAKKKFSLTSKQLVAIYFYYSNWPLRRWYAHHKLKGLRKTYFNSIDEDLFRSMADACRDPFELQKLEITKTQIPALLRYEDRNSMYHSIETRLPFLDWQLLEFNLSIPADYKMRNGWSKYPIRETMHHKLPDAITWRRKKLGFNSPDKQWFDDAGYYQELINSSEILKQLFSHPQKVLNIENGMYWKMINIACWERAFNVSL